MTLSDLAFSTYLPESKSQQTTGSTTELKILCQPGQCISWCLDCWWCQTAPQLQGRLCSPEMQSPQYQHHNGTHQFDHEISIGHFCHSHQQKYNQTQQWQIPETKTAQCQILQFWCKNIFCSYMEGNYYSHEWWIHTSR